MFKRVAVRQFVSAGVFGAPQFDSKHRLEDHYIRLLRGDLKRPIKNYKIGLAEATRQVFYSKLKWFKKLFLIFFL